MSVYIVGLLLVVFVSSWLFTGAMRRYALDRNLLDIPNDRSSHGAPTPRGGGLAIVITFLASCLVLLWLKFIETPMLIGLMGAGVFTAIVGFVDDHRHVAARFRLLAHFIAAVWLLFWIGGLPPIPMFGVVMEMEWLRQLLAVVYLVWLLNLYNFMDGIDGIASIEAITVCIGGVFLILIAQPSEGKWVVPAMLAAAVGGFLLWNWPRARMFMGDVGSGFLGVMLGLFALEAAGQDPRLFWGWSILLGVFIVDATVTLIRRMVRGEKFYEAHRSHAYQYASRAFQSHQLVASAVGIINMVWLLPMAILVGSGLVDGAVGLLIAYSPLVLLAFHYRAGAVELQHL